MNQRALLTTAWSLLSLAAMPSGAAVAAAPRQPEAENSRCYLFTSFRGNGEDGLYLAWSRDGYAWTPLNDNKPLVAPKVGKDQLMRDPCIIQGRDGTFHMVWTVSWGDRVIGYARSKDLIEWSEQKAIPVMTHEPQAKNCWAPELFYDDLKQRFLIFWSTTIPGRFPETDGPNESDWNHRIYCRTTTDFQSFSPTRLFFDPGFNVIDATLLKADGKYHLFIKQETPAPVKKHIRHAVAETPEGPFGPLSKPLTPTWTEGPSAIRVGDEYLVYFDHYRKHYYGAIRSTDLVHWEEVSDRMSFPKNHRHGSVLEVSEEILDGLRKFP